MEASSKKIAILQSNYIPWKGYFDIIQMVDEFILYDDVQYTKGDWRNRNKIKTKDGLKWLTVPVNFSLSDTQKIKDVQIVDNGWQKKHWQTISQSYAHSKHIQDYYDIFENIYIYNKYKYLSD